jgi:O-antigen/teichoic acid export membrane protein
MCVFIQPLTMVIPKYAKWEPALLGFVFFTLSIGWAAISTPLTNTLNAVGQINKTLKLMVMWTVLTWIVTPILVWKFGFNGVAMSAFVISFTSFLPIIFVKKIVPIRVWDQVWRQLAAAIAMGAVGVVGRHVWGQSLTMMGVGMLVTGGTYALTLGGVGFTKLRAEFKSLRSS